MSAPPSRIFAYYLNVSVRVAFIEEVLKGLLKSQEMLNENFKNKRVTTEYYLKQSEEFRKKIDKCRKKLGEK